MSVYKRQIQESSLANSPVMEGPIKSLPVRLPVLQFEERRGSYRKWP